MKEHEQKVIEQYKAEIEEGLMIKLSLGDAIERYGADLVIAATGAIARKGAGPDGEVRVIYDGTNGVFLNYGIKIRDQVQCPTAGDIKAVLSELHAEGGSFFQLLFDVSKAHRRVPVEESEWGRPACQVKGSAATTAQARRSRSRSKGVPAPLVRNDFSPRELAEDVYLNKVGTLGVSSEGYWWGRAGAAAMRLGHYLVGFENAIWALLYSDDGDLIGRTDYPERGLLTFLLSLVLVGIPLSWKKLRGGTKVEWIGYLLDVARFEVGVTETRALWAANWMMSQAWWSRRGMTGVIRTERMDPGQILVRGVGRCRPTSSTLKSTLRSTHCVSAA